VFLLFSVWNSVNVLIFYTEAPPKPKYFFDKITWNPPDAEFNCGSHLAPHGLPIGVTWQS
jgi:hypothetical protein